ncbi:thiol-activated cytolysin family protein [Chitinophaga pendula]|uniref:thiol-activated cytolysin family protein n=1 Tax=Chitinophaga TaxID=79328 RepID=UPI000BAEB1E1|nr:MULTISPECIES: thiol-activated cytolysin family protein [Chitinophaga]ASZ13169.1 hypothetical protein CK934_20490 [Chitinophaga sp. MD30]UCJ09207.1 thiol-activated cytolysin family protein [Chitinophaga pendula]
MKIYSMILLTGMSCLLLAACQKKEQELTQLPVSGNVLSAFSKMPKYPEQMIRIQVKNAPYASMDPIGVRQALDQQKLSGDPDFPGRPGSIGYVNPVRDKVFDLDGATSSYSIFFESNEHAVYDDYADQIYPGALINGKSVETFEFNPVIGNYTPKPITVSVSLPAQPSAVAGTIPLPSRTATDRLVNNILLGGSVPNGGFSKYNLNIKEFSFYDELKEFFATGVNTNAIFFNKSTGGTRDVKKIARQTGLMAKFIQKNFTVDMDIPKAGQLLDAADVAALGQYSPLYVSSVTYGRLGIIAVESNYSFDKLNTAFKKAFNIIGINGSNTLTQEELNVINSADIKVYLVGGNGSQAVATINGFEHFKSYLGGGQTFSADAPGVPITFSLRYLSDHAAYKAKFEINYGSIDKVYARFEYRNVRFLPPVYNDPADEIGEGQTSWSKTARVGDLRIGFYSNSACTQPVAARNFVGFNVERSEYYVRSPEGYSYTYPFNELRKNELKGNYILLSNELFLSSEVESFNNQYPGSTLVTRKHTYKLLPGAGYIIAPEVTIR